MADFVITLSFNKRDEARVSVAFTTGLAALEQGLTTAIILLLEAVFIGRIGYADDIDVGEPFVPVKEMLEAFLGRGGQLMVCSSSLKYAQVQPQELLPQVQVITAGEMVKLLVNARSNLQLN